MRYHAIRIEEVNRRLLQKLFPDLDIDDNLHNWVVIPEDGSRNYELLSDFGFKSRFGEQPAPTQKFTIHVVQD